MTDEGIVGQRLRLGQQAAAGLAATLMLALATPAAAQQADTLPFRAGQWGAEFTASDFSGVGALRFSSPRNAWLIDVQGRFMRQSGNTSSLSRFEVVTDADVMQVRLGWRRYGTVAPRVVRHAGVGVLSTYASSKQSPGAFSVTRPFSLDASRVEFSAGVFAEVGAQWLITSNLGLGATWSANLQAGRADIERFTASGIGEPERAKTGVNTLSVTLGALAIRGTVYF